MDRENRGLMSSPSPTASSPENPKGPSPADVRVPLGWYLVLPVILLFIFYKSLSDPLVIFSNDAPLGLTSSVSCRMPGILSGFWQSLNWVGKGEGSALPSLSYGLLYLLGPVGYAKFGVPIALAFLGFSAMTLFRCLGFAPLVQVVGGVACALNMSAFSSSAWGLLAWALLRGTSFLAVAALAARNPCYPWLNAILAGAAVGMGVMDGADLGAFFSLYVAAFAVFMAFVGPGLDSGTGGVRSVTVMRGLARLAVVVVAAGILAAHALQTLIGSQIKGIEGTAQDAATKEMRWAEATQWSLPKIELIRVLIPGVFGYGMPGMYGIPNDAYEGANYWGRVGQSEGNDKDRLSGSGEYAGVLVVLVAIWGVVQTFRRNERAIRADERAHVWFWTGAAVVSVLLAFGKHAPFYKILYALPYFSTVRNPIKFMHPFQFSLIILFGYGLQGFWRLYMQGQETKPSGLGMVAGVKSWYRQATGVDRQFVHALLGLLGASVAGWLVYAASGRELRRHLKTCFPDGTPEAFIEGIASFSLGDVGVYVVFLAVSIALLALVMSGYFRGGRVAMGGMVMAGLLAVDLGRANQPWLIYFNYRERYSSNPIIDHLKQAPHENRVHGMLPFFPPDQQAAMALQGFQQFYFLEWLQHRFQFYNIQSLDVSQEPRLASDKKQYLTAFRTGSIRAQARYWELTNTRYILGVNGSFIELLNSQLDPEQRRFRLHTGFNLVQAQGDARATAEPNPAGNFALIEFTGALPRAKLYSSWEVIPEGDAQLQRITDLKFDPHQTVVVADRISAPTVPLMLAPVTQGKVEIVDYLPRRVKLKTSGHGDCVLLLNDRYDPQWKVFVDGKPETVLRCNFISRGVRLSPGQHEVEFRYDPPATTLYVSLGAIVASLLLTGFVAISRKN